MSFLDFFKKKSDNGPKNINGPTDNQSEKVASKSPLSNLMNEMY